MTIEPKPEHYRAAAALVRRGWARHSYAEDPDGRTTTIHDPGARLCANGALALAAGARLCMSGTMPRGDDANALARPLFLSLQRARLEASWSHDDGLGYDDEVNEWNGEECRTQDEVAAALDRCADELERGELGP